MPAKYQCPYCNKPKMDRQTLTAHIGDTHQLMLPEGWSAEREVFKIIYGKTHGNCVICGKPTDWNEKTNKYQRLCSDKCRKKYTEQVRKNIYKVHHMSMKDKLNDPEFQDKMLKGRHISGKYTFSNGETKDYVGSYEKNLLEFWDKVMEIDPKDLMCPGPTLEYIDRKTKQKRKWITDQFYIPYNLIIEVKDGGNNPNKAIVDRNKQYSKEDMIINQTKYNYLRLTDNDFGQLMSILTELRLNTKPDGVLIRINETVGSPVVGFEKDDSIVCEPENESNSADIQSVSSTPTKKEKKAKKDLGEWFGESSLIVGSYESPMSRGTFMIPYLRSSKVMLKEMASDTIDIIPLKNFKEVKVNLFKYQLVDPKNPKKSYDNMKRYFNLLKDVKKVKKFPLCMNLIEMVSGKTMYTKDQILYDKDFTKLKPELEFLKESSILESIKSFKGKDISMPIIDTQVLSELSIRGLDDSIIREDMNGYFVFNKSLQLRSPSTRDYDSLKEMYIRFGGVLK